MAVSAISNLSTWLSQVNGSQSQNLSAKATGGSGQSVGTSKAGSGQLAALFENLLQQLVSAGGVASAAAGTAASAVTSGASATAAASSATSAASAATSAAGTQSTQMQALSGHGQHVHGAGGSSSSQQMALNQLLQELKLGSSSTTTTAASTSKSAQHGTSSQQLLSQLQKLMQGGTSSVGSIVSALV